MNVRDNDPIDSFDRSHRGIRARPPLRDRRYGHIGCADRVLRRDRLQRALFLRGQSLVDLLTAVVLKLRSSSDAEMGGRAATSA